MLDILNFKNVFLFFFSSQTCAKAVAIGMCRDRVRTNKSRKVYI